MKRAKMAPILPGEILREEFLTPLAITPGLLAQELGMPQSTIAAILAGERGITADTALRLARHFGNSEAFWLNLQSSYDLETAKDALGTRIEAEMVSRPGA